MFIVLMMLQVFHFYLYQSRSPLEFNLSAERRIDCWHVARLRCRIHLVIDVHIVAYESRDAFRLAPLSQEGVRR